MSSSRSVRRDLRRHPAHAAPGAGDRIPVALCQVLRLRAAPARLQAGSRIGLRVEGGTTALPFTGLAAGPLAQSDGRLWLPVTFAALRPGAAEQRHQMLAVEGCVDCHGRTRLALLCPEPSCQRRSRALYRLVTDRAFRCGRCARVDYRPLPPLRSRPTQLVHRLARVLERADALTQAALRDGAEQGRDATMATRPSSHRGVSPARRLQLEHRRAALAELWAHGLWRTEDLALLFGVSERSIRRDLCRARAEGRVPQAGARERRQRQLAEAEQLSREAKELAREVERHLWSGKRAARLWAAVALAELYRAESHLLTVRAALSPLAAAPSPSRRPSPRAQLEMLGLSLLTMLGE